MIRQSLFKNLFILLFSIGMLTSMWWVFVRSFRFLNDMGGIGMIVIPRLFSLFFLGLMLLLFLSGLLAAYTTLYRSKETPFLLLQPANLDAIVAFKLIESACYASWAFFFIIIPFVSAYAAHEKLSVWFTGWSLLYALPFVLVISFASSLCVIIVTRFLPRNPKLWLMILAITGVGLVFWVIFKDVPLNASRETTVLMLDKLIPGLKIAEHPLLPSRWLSQGLLAIPGRQFSRSFAYLMVLMANAAFFFALSLEAGVALYFKGWQGTLVSPRTGKRSEQSLSLLQTLLRFVPQDLRAIIIKDMRLFTREPQQWLQVVFFFGLLAIYFISLRNVRYQQLQPIWKNLITFLNIFSIACVLTSLGSRFVFPQISLEGQAFWIVGMAPTSMGRVLFLKFTLAVLGMGSVSLVLISLATQSLQVDFGTFCVALFTGGCIAISIAALSTGNGAIFLNLEQSNPTAIVSSFGGTLNLVMCLLCLFTAIIPFAAIYHFWLIGRIDNQLFSQLRLVIAGYLVMQTVVFTVIPLYLGRRSLENRNY